MSTISGDSFNPKETEVADKEPVVHIERIKVSLHEKLLRNVHTFLPLGSGWPLICIYAIIMGIVSISVVIYLKAMGEWTPFCLYDNWYYLSYYFFLCIFGAMLIPLSDFDLYPPTSRFWLWARRMGAYSLFIEVEGVVYMVVFFKDIAYEIEFDDEAQVVVWSMATLGFIRFLTIAFAYWSAVSYLSRVERRNKLPANYFGKTFTDMCDILVAQMICQSLYTYQLNIYNFIFILSVSYLYIALARF